LERKSNCRRRERRHEGFPANVIVAGNPARIRDLSIPKRLLPWRARVNAKDTIPFLDLATMHIELEQELTEIFKRALRTAGFIVAR